MNTALLLAALVVLLAGTAAADTIAAGPLEVQLDRARPADCLAATALPCPAWHDTGASPSPSDDTFYLAQDVASVSIHAFSPVGGDVDQTIDLRNSSIPITIFQDYHALHAQLHAIEPAPIYDVVDLDIDESGIHPHWPGIGPDGYEEPSTYTWEWDNDFVNYTGIHLPYTTYDRDTDYIPRSLVFACPLHDELGDASCIPADAGSAASQAWQNTLPDLVLGAEVDQARVQVTDKTAETTDPQPSLQPTSSTAEADPRLPSGSPSEVALDRAAPFVVARDVEPRGASAALRSAFIDTSQAARTSEVAGSRLLFAAAAVALPLFGWLLYHRITRARCLDHATRTALLDIARSQPGILVGEAAKTLGMSFHTVDHHVRILRRAGHLESVKVGRNVALYATGSVPLKAREPLVHLRRGPQGACLKQIHLHPGASLTELSSLLGTTKSSTHAKLVRLQRWGLIAREAGGYAPTEAGMEMLRTLERVQPRAQAPATSTAPAMHG